MNRTNRLACAALIAALTWGVAAHADGEKVFTLTLKDQAFSPKELSIPAHEKVKLTVKNENTGVAEFESSDLNREKIITPGSKATVYVGPLEPGKYTFFDDFHRSTTGTLVAQ
ncbi:MAG TPA: cupredoxin domain-containing protein [Rickettsiales bacterium]|nr:cupredoxin domain-containing protein [Rickettsiales bacterium]